MTQRGRRGTVEGSIKEDGYKEVVILAVHHSSVELSKIDERIKPLDGESRPGRMVTIREKDWPKDRGFPDGKDDHATS